MPNDQPDWTTSVSRLQYQLTGSPWNYPTGTTLKNFPVLPGTAVIGILLPQFGLVSSLIVKGHVSGVFYLDVNPQVLQYPDVFYITVHSAVDTSIDVTITTTAGFTVYISSIPDPVASNVVFGQPAPWQAPNQPPLSVLVTNPGSGNSVVIIPNPLVGQSVFLHSFEWQWSAGPAGLFGLWQDNSGVSFGVDNPAANNNPKYMDWKGAKLTTGFGMGFLQTGTAAAGTVTLDGTITYSVF